MNIDFEKGNGLVPVIVQDDSTLEVLMLGYMNKEAYLKTMEKGMVTFYSRSKERLWTKGEQSGHYLLVKHIAKDCDSDTLLINVQALGPTCHKGSVSCFATDSKSSFVYYLESVISKKVTSDDDNSYTRKIYNEGVNKIAQKVGEEAVELIIESKDNDLSLFKNEAADLLFHYLILLKKKGVKFTDIEEVLRLRHESVD